MDVQTALPQAYFPEPTSMGQGNVQSASTSLRGTLAGLQVRPRSIVYHSDTLINLICARSLSSSDSSRISFDLPLKHVNQYLNSSHPSLHSTRNEQR